MDKSPLQNLRVASPCSASWREMEGDDRVRHCSLCSRNVYNLSEMTSDEAKALILNSEGRLCVRFYQRADGKVLTKDCPRGLLTVRVRLAKAMAVAAGLMVSGFGLAIINVSRDPESEPWSEALTSRGRAVPGVSWIIDKISPPATTGDVALGRLATPPPATGPVAPKSARGKP